ncbi:MAG: hypothetical protein ABI743_09790 [bacterium]
MINTLFADPDRYMTPESVVAEYFDHMEEAVLFMSCERCNSIHIKVIHLEARRMCICHDCGDVYEAPPLN